MGAQVFHVVDFKMGVFHAAHDVAHGVQLSIGKDVAVDELAVYRGVPAFFVVGDAMVQKQAAGPQYAHHGGVVDRQIGQPHMFKHADAGDFVVNAFPLQVAVITHFKGDLVLQTQACDALGGVIKLLLAQGDAVGIDAIMLRRPAHHGTPAAADIQKALTQLQAQFAANMVQLVALRLLQCVGRGFKISTGVNHLLVQPEFVKRVGHVVMKGNGGEIAVLGVVVGEVGRVGLAGLVGLDRHGKFG